MIYFHVLNGLNSSIKNELFILPVPEQNKHRINAMKQTKLIY